MKYFGLFLILNCLGCREYFDPPALKNTPKYLVVDGLLTSSPDSTSITLTYTRSLKDTAPGKPELNARLTVEGDGNTTIPLTEIGNGHYSNLLTLNPIRKIPPPNFHGRWQNLSFRLYTLQTNAADRQPLLGTGYFAG